VTRRMTPSRLFSPLFNISYLRLWREVWQYAAEQKRIIVAYHVMFLFAMCFDLAVPWLFGELVNTLQKADGKLFENSARLLGYIVLCKVGMWALHGPGRVLERRAGQIVYINYIDAMFRRLTELPLSWHQDHHSGGTINRIRTAGLALRGFAETGFISFQRVVTLLGSLAILVWFNAMIGFASLVSFILSMSLVIMLNRKMTHAIHDSNEATHIGSATFFDFVSNIVSIVILRLQGFAQSTMRSKLALVLPPYVREARINEWRYFIYTMLNVLMLSAILLGYIHFQIGAGVAIAAGTLVTVYMYQDRVGSQGFDFMTLHGTWLNSLTSLRATQHLIDDHARLVPDGGPYAPENWNGISLSHLNFTYRKQMTKTEGTLQNINLAFRKGEKIALIGGSGAGKSTLLSLLRALHAPQQVETAIDGTPVPFAALAELTTLIPQDPEIFENTIRFNVSFGLEAPDEAVYRALALAEFMPVLERLNDGLDTDIREKGVNLSVGQKQRLSLARGIFAAERSDIILLDEPTSSVDLPTEERIFRNIFTHFHNKTLIATLHRLHLLPAFDRIVYLDQGRITADLPAAEALAQPGPIRDIYRMYQKQEA
jgi:ABC-type multidrug transport system fused ATPase/permease subunit